METEEQSQSDDETSESSSTMSGTDILETSLEEQSDDYAPAPKQMLGHFMPQRIGMANPFAYPRAAYDQGQPARTGYSSDTMQLVSEIERRRAGLTVSALSETATKPSKSVTIQADGKEEGDAEEVDTDAEDGQVGEACVWARS